MVIEGPGESSASLDLLPIAGQCKALMEIHKVFLILLVKVDSDLE